MTIIHVQHVVTAPRREWWVCDENGERLMKIRSRAEKDAVDYWRRMNPDEKAPKKIRYEGVSKTAEAAAVVHDLLMKRSTETSKT